jgi:hypothetical protein|tara:strand:- start:580 stop:927 length:348 start_codon:yes stop_codon:yes gene_type:complete
MDERLAKALEASKLLDTINQQKKLLQQQYDANLIHYENGCQFTSSKELISFCQSLISLEQDQIVLIDDNGLPSMVSDLSTFTNNLVNTYATASNKFFSEYNKIKKQRSVEGIFND